MSKVRAIVAGHADFATGIVSAVVQITGRDDVFLALSNRDMSAQDVERAMRELASAAGIRVIFTDLPAGSCTMAARRLQREHPGLSVVTGTNLAALLDFVFSDDVAPDEASRQAADKGRSALMVTGGGPVEGRVPLELFRIDDRLIHGQVVVGWGQPLDLRFIVLVDDEVAASEWEQELYRMGVPPEMDVYFESVPSAAERLAQYQSDSRPGLLLTGDIETMTRLVHSTGGVAAVNLGGIHHKPGRVQRLRYVFLSGPEEEALRALAASGVVVTAQDVPAGRPLPLEEVLAGEGNR